MKVYKGDKGVVSVELLRERHHIMLLIIIIKNNNIIILLYTIYLYNFYKSFFYLYLFLFILLCSFKLIKINKR